MKTMLPITSIALCFLLVCPLSEGAEWKLVTSNASGDYFIDTDYLTHPPAGIVRVRLKLVHSDKSTALYTETYGDRFAALKLTKSVWDLRCPTREIRLVSLVHEDARGRPIYSYDNKNADLEPAEPGPVEIPLLNLVCTEKSGREGSNTGRSGRNP